MNTNQDKNAEIAFFQKRTSHQNYEVLTQHAYQKLIHPLKKTILSQISTEAHVIELACGTGAFTKYIKKALPVKTTLYALDLTPTALIQTQKNIQTNGLIHADIEHLPIKSDSMDIVIFSAVLHHFSNIEPCLKEAYRILKKRGCLYSFDPYSKNLIMQFYHNPKSPFFGANTHTKNERLLSKKTYYQGCKACEFTDISTLGVNGITFQHVDATWAKGLLPVYNMIENMLDTLHLSKICASFLIGLARK